MARYTLFVLVVLGSAASAIAAIAPNSTDLVANSKNVTVIEKNQAFPLVGPLVVQECVNEDCSIVKG